VMVETYASPKPELHSFRFVVDLLYTEKNRKPKAKNSQYRDTSKDLHIVAPRTPIDKVSCRSTGGNFYKLVKETTRINIRKYSFTSRIANTWNNLPNYVADVHSVDLFKTRLDKCRRCQDVVFDWKADLTGAGDRLESSVLSV